jgi:MFS transporter, UMF1 family
MSTEKNNEKVIRSWAIFDWANSAYALVISTAIFPSFFIAYSPETINILGYKMTNSALYSFAVSFSYIIIAALSPILSGMADFSGRRMFFLKMFTLIGAINCSILFFFKGEAQMWLGTSAFILATIGFAGSLVFYDSYLPIIATEDQFDKISARGYSYGYIGSVILLLFILSMILKPQFYGIENENLPARIGFLLVGVWWFGFAQITFKNLPKDSLNKLSFSSLSNGYSEIRKVFNNAKKNASIINFLFAFFLYSAGVQTVIYLATIFAEKELGMKTAELIGVVLIIQLIAILGAWLFAKISNRVGNRNAIIYQILIWIVICMIAYNTNSKAVFYLTAALVGMVLGGIQALSRATYSKLLEGANTHQDLTSYFSLYDVLYKLSIVSGTFLFGLAFQITGNMRYSILVLATLFIFSLLFIRKVNVPQKNKLNHPN